MRVARAPGQEQRADQHGADTPLFQKSAGDLTSRFGNPHYVRGTVLIPVTKDEHAISWVDALSRGLPAQYNPPTRLTPPFPLAGTTLLTGPDGGRPGRRRL